MYFLLYIYIFFFTFFIIFYILYIEEQPNLIIAREEGEGGPDGKEGEDGKEEDREEKEQDEKEEKDQKVKKRNRMTQDQKQERDDNYTRAIELFLDQKEWRNFSPSRCSVKQLKEQVEVVLQPLLSTFDPKLFRKSLQDILKTRQAVDDEEVEKEKLKKKLDVEEEKLKVFGLIAKLCSSLVECDADTRSPKKQCRQRASEKLLKEAEEEAATKSLETDDCPLKFLTSNAVMESVHGAAIVLRESLESGGCMKDMRGKDHFGFLMPYYRFSNIAKDFLPSVTLIVLPETMVLLQAAVEEQVKTTVKSARIQQLQSGSQGPLTVADLVSNDYLTKWRFSEKREDYIRELKAAGKKARRVIKRTADHSDKVPAKVSELAGGIPDSLVGRVVKSAEGTSTPEFRKDLATEWVRLVADLVQDTCNYALKAGTTDVRPQFVVGALGCEAMRFSGFASAYGSSRSVPIQCQPMLQNSAASDDNV